MHKKGFSLYLDLNNLEESYGFTRYSKLEYLKLENDIKREKLGVELNYYLHYTTNQLVLVRSIMQ